MILIYNLSYKYSTYLWLQLFIDKKPLFCAMVFAMIQHDSFQWACILSNKRLFQSNNKTLKYLTNHVMNSFHLGYFHVTLFYHLSETLT